MGHRVFKEPSGYTYAIFSSVTETFTVEGLTSAEVIDYYAEDGRLRGIETGLELLGQAKAGKYRYPMGPQTYEDAMISHTIRMEDDALRAWADLADKAGADPDLCSS